MSRKILPEENNAKIVFTCTVNKPKNNKKEIEFQPKECEGVELLNGFVI